MMKRQAPASRRVLIECSNTYQTDILTGIQRVVQSIVKSALEVPIEGVEIIPVVIDVDCFKRIPQLDMKTRSIDVGTKAAATKARALQIAIFVLKALWWIPKKLYKLCRNQFRRLSVWPRKGRMKLPVVPIREDDIILMLDSSWHIDVPQTLGNAKNIGAQIYFVVYDLIPITHPQFCDDSLVKQFVKFYEQVLPYSNGFIAISQTICNEMRGYVAEMDPDKSETLRFDHFYLGAAFGDEPTAEDDSIDPEVGAFFEQHKSVYLCVSTLEPRKNHAMILDAFDRLWAEGHDVALCWVGRLGWKVDELLTRVEQHPENGARFMWRGGLSDAELLTCYQKSRCLVSPSFAEGFGLPILEALQEKLPVIASDIAVYREIFDGMVMFVDPHSSVDLVEMISTIQQNGIPEEYKPAEQLRWPSWNEATQSLLNKVLTAATPPS